MAGSELKNTLSLDVSKFNAALENAAGKLEMLDKQFKGVGEVTAGFEKGISSVVKGLSLATDRFAALDQTLKSFSGRMESASFGFDSVTSKSNSAAKGMDGLSKALKNTMSLTADDWVKRYANDIGSLSPALNKAVTAIVAFDRANIASAESTKSAINQTTAAKLKALEAERSVNRQIIDDRAKMVIELDALQRGLEARSSNARSTRSRDSTGRFTKSNDAVEFAAAAEAARTEMTAVNSVVKELKWKNAEIDKSIKLIHDQTAAERALAATQRVAASQAKAAAQADKEARSAQVTAAKAQTTAMREFNQQRRNEALATARFEREQAQQITQMWKGMGQLWAASKIEHGVGASITSAGEMQNAQLNLKGLNLSQEQMDRITKQAWNDSHVLKFASALDMVRAKLALIGGLPNASEGQLNALMPTIAKAANSIQILTGDKSAKGLEDIVRNISGVIEARGQTNDLQAAKDTADLLLKIAIGTGRKIDIADVETLLRRDGTGADKLSNMGMAKLVAFMDAAKVSGGHGGSGSSGVSTVGTMVKMYQKQANGGMQTVRASKEFLDAGLIDTSVIAGKHGADAIRAMRTGGLIVGPQANRDPVGSLQNIAQHAIEYMSRPENKKKFFGNASVTDKNAIADAMMKFATMLGWSTNAAQMLTMAGNKDIMARAEAQYKQIMGSKSVDAFNTDVMKSYDGNVRAFKASMDNLKNSIGTGVLPEITKLVDGITNVTTAFGDFAQENPMATSLTTATVAVGGLVLGIKSMVMLFGTFRSTASAIAAFTGATQKADVAAAELATTLGASKVAAAEYGATMGAAATKSNLAAADMELLGAGATGVAGKVESAVPRIAKFAGGIRLIGTAVMEAGALVAKGFLRMIPWVGALLIAWDLSKLLGNLTVGGHKIKDWMTQLMDSLVTSAENGWARIKVAFTIGTEAHAKALAGLQGQIDTNNQKGHDSKVARGFAQSDQSKANDFAAAGSMSPVTQLSSAPNLTAFNPGASSASRAFLQNTGISQPSPIRPYAPVSMPASNSTLATSGPTPTWAANNITATDIVDSATYKNSPADIAAADKNYGEKAPRSRENLWTRAVHDQMLKSNAQELTLRLVKSNEDASQTFAEMAKNTVIQKFAAGRYDKNGEPAKDRQAFLKKGYTYNATNDAYYNQAGQAVSVENAVDMNKKVNGFSMNDVSNMDQAQLKAKASSEALTFALSRQAATAHTLANASTRASIGVAKQSREMLALTGDFVRYNARANINTSDPKNAPVVAAEQSALTNQAGVDALKTSGDLTAKTGVINTDLARGNENNASHVDRVKKRYADQIAAEHLIVDARKATLTAQMAQDQQGTASWKAALDAKMALQNSFYAWEKAMDAKQSADLQTPLQNLTDSWKNTSVGILNSETKWANDFQSLMQKTLDGGFQRINGSINSTWVNFRNGLRTYLASIALDIRDTFLKSATSHITDYITGGIGKVASAIADYASGLGGSAAGTAAGSAATDSSSVITGAIPSWAMSGTGSASTATSAATASSSIMTLATSAATAATALQTMSMSAGASSALGGAGSAVGGAGSSMGSIGGLMSLFGSGASAGAGSAATSVVTASPAWTGLVTGAAAKGAWFDGAVSAFAKGGAFTNGVYSQPTIFKFASGGQFGVMGEAGPEAVMPLTRDSSGRLGVANHGANQSKASSSQNGGAVTISIVVNGANGTSTSSGNATGAASQWNGVAEQVKALVLQQMVQEQRPGGLLYK